MEPVKGELEAGPMQLEVFGEFQLRGSGGSVILDDRAGRKTAILKYLACHPDGKRSMAEMAEALWPESSDASAHGNLRVALYKLKTCLRSTGNPIPIKISGSLVCLEREAIVVDAWVAERRAEEALRGDCSLASLCDVLDVFGQDLLPAEAYEEWTSRYRTRIDALHRDLLLRTLRQLQRQAVDLKTARMVDRLAYDYVRHEPGDLDIVPEFVRYLVARNRFTEAGELRRCFIEQEGDAALLPALRAAESSLPIERPESIEVAPTEVKRSELDAERPVDVTLNAALSSLFEGTGQIVVLNGKDQADCRMRVDSLRTKAQSGGAIVCEIPDDESPFLHRCAFALERVCGALRFDKKLFSSVDSEIMRLHESCAQLRAGSMPENEYSGFAYRLTVAIRTVARHMPMFVTIERGDRLDSAGADFLAQLFLLARWYGLFVLVQMNLGTPVPTPATNLVDAVRGSVQFVNTEESETEHPLPERSRRRAIVRAFPGVARLSRFRQIGA